MRTILLFSWISFSPIPGVLPTRNLIVNFSHKTYV